MTHSYIRFRIKLARHAVAQLAARLQSSAEILLIVLGPAVVGLLAFAALPAMLAASQAPILALALLLLHGAAMSLPMLLLRPRVVPADVRDWLHPLPIPPALERRACAAVACLLLAPLALAYMASLAIWLYQAPAWLLPARAAAGTVLSFLFTWLCAAWLLARAGGPPRAARKPAAVATAAAYIARPRHGWFYLWCQLFWLPLWRKGALAGLRQAALLLAACIAFPAWMTGPSFMPRALGAVLASVLLVLLAHEADTQLRSQAGRVRAAAAAWPLDAGKLAWHARALLLLGFGCALLLVAAGGAWHGTAARLWLLLAGATPPLLVLTPPFTARGRMALVASCIVVLCAVGSKVWS
jgi:hypothetical protein